jgi:hypothetical protein
MNALSGLIGGEIASLVVGIALGLLPAMLALVMFQ